MLIKALGEAKEQARNREKKPAMPLSTKKQTGIALKLISPKPMRAGVKRLLSTRTLNCKVDAALQALVQ